MSKARFNEADIAAAVNDFIVNTPGRDVPAVGKNSSVTVYGENNNPYKPIIVKEAENEPDETVSGSDIGVEFPGLD